MARPMQVGSRGSSLGGSAPDLISLLRGASTLHKAVLDLPPVLLEMSELDLERFILKEEGDEALPRILGLLKITLWEEFKRALNEKRTMRQDNIVRGVCSIHYFTRNVLTIPAAVAWLVLPPADELLLQRELVALGLKKLREVLVQDIFIERTRRTKDDEGNSTEITTREVNVPLVKEIHNIVKTIQDRIHGAVIQRHQIDQKTEQKVLQVNVTPEQAQALANVPQEALPVESEYLSLESLEAFDKRLSTVVDKLQKIEKTTLDVVADADYE